MACVKSELLYWGFLHESARSAHSQNLAGRRPGWPRRLTCHPAGTSSGGLLSAWGRRMNGKLGVARAVAFEPMAHGAQFGVRVALAGQTRSVHIWVLTTELLTHKKYTG